MNVILNNTMTVTSNNLNEDFYKFSVDWLNIRLDNVDLETFFNGMHCLFPELSNQCFVLRDGGGVCHYPYAYYLADCGYSSFIINFALDDDGCIAQADTVKPGQVYGILLSISGDGCRFINSLRPDGFFDFVNFLAGFDFNCTRIDVCCDILDKDNQIIPMIQEFAINCNLDIPPIYLKSGMKRNSANYCTINPMWDKDAKDYVMNVTIGGRASKRGTLQIYDKKLELSSGRLTQYKEKLIEAYNHPDYWWRLEYRCKSFANDIFVELITSNSIYSTFLKACNRFGTFVIPSLSGGLHDFKNAEVLVEWACFLKFLEGLKNRKLFISCSSPARLVSLPFVHTETDKVRDFALRQMAGFFAKLEILYNLDPQFRHDVDIKKKEWICKKRYIPFLKQVCREFNLSYVDLSTQIWEQDDFFVDIA